METGKKLWEDVITGFVVGGVIAIIAIFIMITGVNKRLYTVEKLTSTIYPAPTVIKLIEGVATDLLQYKDIYKIGDTVCFIHNGAVMKGKIYSVNKNYKINKVDDKYFWDTSINVTFSVLSSETNEPIKELNFTGFIVKYFSGVELVKCPCEVK